MQISPLPNLALQAELGRPATGPARATTPVASTLLPDAVQPFPPMDPVTAASKRQIADPSDLGFLRKPDLSAKDDPGPYGPSPAFRTSMLAHMRANALDWPQPDEAAAATYDRAAVTPNPAQHALDLLA
jgi:hypothetical protein